MFGFIWNEESKNSYIDKHEGVVCDFEMSPQTVTWCCRLGLPMLRGAFKCEQTTVFTHSLNSSFCIKQTLAEKLRTVSSESKKKIKRLIE